MPTTPSTLSPEFRKAVEFIDSLLLDKTKIELTDAFPISQNICYQDQIYISKHMIKTRTIPGGDCWRWNQSKGRQLVKLTRANISGSLHKLIPRRRENSNHSIPKFKLWQFAFTYQSKPYHLLWCEKGYDPSLNLKLDDFKFLSPYLDSSVVKQLWPNLELKPDTFDLFYQ